jgi:hypothetical protein
MRAAIGDGNGFPDQLLDIAQERHFVGVAQRNRNAERRSLAVSGLRSADQVAAHQSCRSCLCLYGSSDEVFFFCEGRRAGLLEPEVMKEVQ